MRPVTSVPLKLARATTRGASVADTAIVAATSSGARPDSTAL
jgi:hypothetical protein